jgi:hypothetical protein
MQEDVTQKDKERTFEEQALDEITARAAAKDIDPVVLRDINYLVAEVRRLRAPVIVAKRLNESRRKYKENQKIAGRHYDEMLRSEAELEKALASAIEPMPSKDEI